MPAFPAVGFLALTTLLAALAAPAPAAAARVRVRGTVTAHGRPVAGAVVRVQATSLATTTDHRGRFVLAVPRGARLTAWADGFYCAGPLGADDGELAFALEALPVGDDPTYTWRSAVTGTADEPACATCHGDPAAAVPALPFDQWRRDAHAGAAVNPRFLSLYAGTDLAGRRSPPARYLATRDYGPVRLPPDRGRPYFGPGYVLDFPASRGNCAACHAPMAAVRDPYGIDPRTLAGVEAEGVGCDLCHKLWEVVLDPATRLPYGERPGVLSMVLRRPPPGRQLFIGPFDDVAPGEDTCSAVQRDSRLCAPCHYGVFWGVEVYGSYPEWLASPYADPSSPLARTCQDCHMPRGAQPRFALPERGGLERDPATVATHLMTGVGDAAFLRAAVRLELAARRDGDQVLVETVVRNAGAGHHLPTDSPLRQVLLVVTAATAAGHLEAVGGPRLPAWAGPQADRPGRAYAKVLEERWTREAPTAAYWNPTRVVEDTRLPALAADRASWRFPAGADAVTVRARLIYRRAFWRLQREKGWSDPDLELATATVVVPARSPSG